MKEALRYMQPAPATDTPPRFSEVPQGRLVGADLLSGHQKVEVHRKVLEGPVQQCVVDIRQNAQAISSRRQLLQGRCSIRKRRPLRQALREEMPAVYRNIETELTGNMCCRQVENFPVGSKRLGLNLGLDPGVQIQNLMTIDRQADFAADPVEGIADSLPPIDQRAIAIERQDVEFSCNQGSPSRTILWCRRLDDQQILRQICIIFGH